MSIRILDEIWQELGIIEALIHACKLPLQEEAANLVSAGMDVFTREQFVTATTLACWHRMKSAAEKDEIELLIVSAYRSIDYQCQLITSKLEKGQDIRDIVRVNAIPGFSEHHTGRAIDITTSDCKPLSTDFDKTRAFEWLTGNAAEFSFNLSYPENNSLGIDYEPWHWACVT
jgi:zinc D-Ala-D-Ala carboxypeptidase